MLLFILVSSIWTNITKIVSTCKTRFLPDEFTYLVKTFIYNILFIFFESVTGNISVDDVRPLFGKIPISASLSKIWSPLETNTINDLVNRWILFLKPQCLPLFALSGDVLFLQGMTLISRYLKQFPLSLSVWFRRSWGSCLQLVQEISTRIAEGLFKEQLRYLTEALESEKVIPKRNTRVPEAISWGWGVGVDAFGVVVCCKKRTCFSISRVPWLLLRQSGECGFVMICNDVGVSKGNAIGKQIQTFRVGEVVHMQRHCEYSRAAWCHYLSDSWGAESVVKVILENVLWFSLFRGSPY